MTHHTRRPVLTVAVILLLAACGSTASSSSVTHTPTAAPTAAAAALVKGEFVGDAGQLAGIALSTNGQQVIAYLCNGSYQHVSLAEWFKGPVTGSGIDITNAHGAHLVATVSAQAITGTVTLKDDTSAPFTARLLPAPGRIYGLFRSEETFKGVRYLGGWILGPPASGTLTSSVFFLPTGVRHGGIINVRTGALIVSPPLHNLVSVTVPGLGTFRLNRCRQARC